MAKKPQNKTGIFYKKKDKSHAGPAILASRSSMLDATSWTVSIRPSHRWTTNQVVRHTAAAAAIYWRTLLKTEMTNVAGGV